MKTHDLFDCETQKCSVALLNGVLVVDLESRRPIALLERRSVAGVAAWLRKHQTIEIVARDRSEEFAAAIREALLQAVQVADRFHLISNLVEHLDRLVTRQWKQLCRAIIPPTSLEQGEAHASYNPTRVQRRIANAEEFERVFATNVSVEEGVHQQDQTCLRTILSYASLRL